MLLVFKSSKFIVATVKGCGPISAVPVAATLPLDALCLSAEGCGTEDAVPVVAASALNAVWLSALPVIQGKTG